MSILESSSAASLSPVARFAPSPAKQVVRSKQNSQGVDVHKREGKSMFVNSLVASIRSYDGCRILDRSLYSGFVEEVRTSFVSDLFFSVASAYCG